MVNETSIELDVMSVTIDPHARRAQLLAFSLHQVECEAARFASAATIHALTNHISAVRNVLYLVATLVGQGKDTEIEMLLELGETSLRQARILLLRTRQARFGARGPSLLSRDGNDSQETAYFD